MRIPRHLRLWAAGITLTGLPAIAVTAPPTSLADDCIGGNINSLECMMNSDNGGFQPGDLVIPAGGGPPEVVVAPAPDGGPVITAGGDIVIPGAPPIG